MIATSVVQSNTYLMGVAFTQQGAFALKAQKKKAGLATGLFSLLR